LVGGFAASRVLVGGFAASLAESLRLSGRRFQVMVRLCLDKRNRGAASLLKQADGKPEAFRKVSGKAAAATREFSKPKQDTSRPNTEGANLSKA
jgi:hypothetical protein